MSGVLVIDGAYKPVGIIAERKAVKLVLLNKVIVELSYEDKYIHSVNISIQVPKVVRLRYVVKFSKKNTKVVTNQVLFARDNYTCQYCDHHKFEHCGIKGGCNKCLPKTTKLTRDHLKPVVTFEGDTRGERLKKANTWDNVVTACVTCNNIKGDKLPYETHMYPKKAPKEPIGAIVTMINRLNKDQFEYVRPFLGKAYKDE